MAGVPDPPNVHRAGAGTDLMGMLRDGTIDAAIVDPVPAGPRFATVVADPETVFHAWCERHAAHTYNHVVVVRESLADDAEAMRELFGAFRDSWRCAGDAIDSTATPLGFEAIRGSLEAAIAAAGAQGLLARPLAVGDLVTDVLASLR